MNPAAGLEGRHYNWCTYHPISDYLRHCHSIWLRSTLRLMEESPQTRKSESLWVVQRNINLHLNRKWMHSLIDLAGKISISHMWSVECADVRGTVCLRGWKLYFLEFWNILKFALELSSLKLHPHDYEWIFPLTIWYRRDLMDSLQCWKICYTHLIS